MRKIKSNTPEWGHSLHRMPWEMNHELTKTEQLISSTVEEWYAAKHRVASEEELSLINNLEIKACPHCGCDSFVKNGFYKSGMQRYKCNSCGHGFSHLTNTIFDSRKIPFSEWIEYLLHLFEFHSIRTSARDNRNANSTGKYWLIKVFGVLKGVQQDVKLHGDVFIDEMFFSVYPRNQIKKDGKQLRGISRNKICVASGIDSFGNILLLVENNSKPSRKSTWDAYGEHIEEGSHLIHDGEHSHNVLVERLHLSETVYQTAITKQLKDEDNPLDRINDFHSLCKRFMRAHGGFNRDDLQDWLNLLWFIMSPPVNRYEKVSKFIEMALSVPLTVRYRQVMGKKQPNNQ